MEENSVLLKNGIRNSNLDIKKVKSDFDQETTTGKNKFIPATRNGETTIVKANCSISLSDDEFSLTASGSDMYFGDVTGVGNNYSDGKGMKIDVNGQTGIYFYITNPDFKNNFITAFNSNNVSLGYTSKTSNKGSYNLPEGTSYITLRIGKSGAISGETYKTKVQITLGSEEDTNYEKYSGGIPAPNPDYPQEMKVVTGTTEVVISENGETLSTQSIRLGDIELVEIGEYKDSIIKENGDYYLVKNIKKIPISPNYTWGYVSASSVAYAQGGIETDWKIGTTHSICKSDYYLGQINTNSSSNVEDNHICFYNTHTQTRLYVRDSRFTSSSQFVTWLNSLDTLPYIYYVLNESTKTKITDTNLISDLDNLKLPEDIEDTNNLSLTVSGNLAGKLEFTYQERIII